MPSTLPTQGDIQKLLEGKLYLQNVTVDSLPSISKSLEILLRDVFDSDIVDKSMPGIVKFLEGFYETVAVEQSKGVRSFEDLCERLKNQLSDFSDTCMKLLQVRYQYLDGFSIAVKSGNSANMIEDMYYYPRQADVLIAALEGDEFILFSTTIERNLSFFSKLYKLAFIVGHKITDNDLFRFYISVLQSIANIVVKVNPLAETRDAYLNEIVEGLKYPEDHDVLDDPEFVEIWKQFQSDLEEGTKPYIRDMAAAIKAAKSGVLYSDNYTIDDYYLSLKGSGSKIRINDCKNNQNNAESSRNHRRQNQSKEIPKGISNHKYKATYQQAKSNKSIPSFVASLAETDPLKDLDWVVEFDNSIGYKSGYRVEPLEGCSTFNAKVIAIENPSKIKNRIIHILCNALQDRCKFLHSRMEQILIHLKGEAFKKQSKILQIFKLYYIDDFINKNHNNGFCWDFESATDKANQSFTRECLKLVWPESYVTFWDNACRLEQRVIPSLSDPYEITQRSGQLQGALGSFPIFSWTHHIVNRLTMLLTGRTNFEADKFYTIVGDDNAMSTITEDPIIDDSEEALREGKATSVQLAHRKVCKWAGLIINPNKSIFNYYNPAQEHQGFIGEAIHQRYITGKCVSPVPPNLLLNYVDPGFALGSIFWAAKHDFSKALCDRLINRRLIELVKEQSNKDRYKYHPDEQIRLSYLLWLLCHIGGNEDTDPFKNTDLIAELDNHYYLLDFMLKWVSLQNLIIASTLKDDVDEMGDFGVYRDGFFSKMNEDSKKTDFFDSMFDAPHFQEWLEGVKSDHKMVTLLNNAQLYDEQLAIIFQTKASELDGLIMESYPKKVRLGLIEFSDTIRFLLAGAQFGSPDMVTFILDNPESFKLSNNYDIAITYLLGRSMRRRASRSGLSIMQCAVMLLRYIPLEIQDEMIIKTLPLWERDCIY